MSWIEFFKQEFSDDLLDYSSDAHFIISVFRGVISPPLYVNNKGKLCVPERYCTLMGGSETLFRVLMQPDLFLALPLSLKHALLDVLLLLLQREPYDIVRMQFVEEMVYSESHGFCRVLLKLLTHAMAESTRSAATVSVCKRIIHCVGLSLTVGATAEDVKRLLSLLREPSELSLALLQCVSLSLKTDPVAGVHKACPPSFFCFGGSGAGLGTSPSAFPFVKEYQFCTWFRVECFHEHDLSPSTTRRESMSSLQQLLLRHDDFQHIVSWQNSSHRGLDLYFENSTLVLCVSQNARTEPLVVRMKDERFTAGVWYFLSLRHAKPKFSLISSDELTLSIDDKVVFSDNVRFPSSSTSSAAANALAETEFFFGKNLDGQMGPIYLFQEALSPAALHAVKRLDGGRGLDSNSVGLTENALPPCDLIKGFTSSSDRKTHNVQSKVSMCFHPCRTHRGFALEIHSGRHAVLGERTLPWQVVSVRELLDALGGVAVLLPLLPRLLIEAGLRADTATDPNFRPDTLTEGVGAAGAVAVSDGKSSLTHNAQREEEALLAVRGECGLGTTLGELFDEIESESERESDRERDSEKERDRAVLDAACLSLLRRHRDECLGDGALSLFLAILSRCLSFHRRHQQDLLYAGGVEMIEYALSCLPSRLLRCETEKCVLSLLQLKAAAAENPALDWRITRALLCNLSLWYTANTSFLASLLSVLRVLVRARPEVYLKLLGVQPFLEALEFFAPEEVSEEEEELRVEREREREKNKIRNKKIKKNKKKESESEKSESETTASPSPSPSVAVSVSVSHSSAVAATPPHTHGERESSTATTATAAPLPLSSSSSVKRRPSSLNINPLSTDLSTPLSLSQTPLLSSRPSVRKLKSFRVALSETLNDGEDEDLLDTEVELQEHANTENGERSSFSGALALGLSAKKERRRSSLRMENVLAALENVAASPSLCQETVSPGMESVLASPRPLPPLPESCAEMEEGVEEEGDEDEDEEGVHGEGEGDEAAEQCLETNAQRQSLRSLLSSSLAALVLQGASERELSPLLDFLSLCKNKALLNELAQLLLSLIVEGGSKIILAITAACRGVEEFASFVLLSFVHQPYEELRCTGIRILTHFCLRLDTLSSGGSGGATSVLSLSLRKYSIANTASATSSLSAATAPIGRRPLLGRDPRGSVGGGGGGLLLLQQCGGMALLCELVTAYSEYSTEATYAALLEMLLTKPNTLKTLTNTLNTLSSPLDGAPFPLQSLLSQLALTTVAAAGTTQTTTQSSTTTRTRTNSSYFSSTPGVGNANTPFTTTTTPFTTANPLRTPSPTTLHFAAYYLSLDRGVGGGGGGVGDDDDGVDMTNALALPLFFQLLPRLPVRVHEQVFTDLLALLKHSAGNRQAFVSCAAWHLSMYDLVRSLLNKDKDGREKDKERERETSAAVRRLRSDELLRELDTSVGGGFNTLLGVGGGVGGGGGGERERAVSFSVFARATSSSRWGSTPFSADLLSPSTPPPSLGLNTQGGGGVWSPPRTATSTFAHAATSPATPQRSLSVSLSLLPNTSAPLTTTTTQVVEREKEKERDREWEKSDSLVSQRDLWFDLGMKVYSTLLLHSVESRFGWREVDLCVAPSLDNDAGHGVIQSVMSGLLNELAFTMRSKYKELQRLAKSSNSLENQLATDKLENVLSILITAMHTALVHERCVNPFDTQRSRSSFSPLGVNRQRVQCFNDLARDLYLKKLQGLARGPGVDAKASMVFEYDLAAFSQCEVRGLVEETERVLRTRLEREWKTLQSERESCVGGEPDSTQNTQNTLTQDTKPEGTHNPLSQDTQDAPHNAHTQDDAFPHFLDLDHEWQDISSDTLGPNTLSPNSPSTSSTTGPDEFSLPLSPTPHTQSHTQYTQPTHTLKSVEELLHPLSREHDLQHGRLVLTLQTLRFFDVLFWPHVDAPLRNVDMLRFIKDSPLVMTSNTSSSLGEKSQLTVFSSVMRMCLYTLTQLSPITHLAVLNVKRMRVLVSALDRVSTSSVSTPSVSTPSLSDWLLVSLTHVTLHLQRVIVSLSPVFALLGLGEQEMRSIPLVGPWDDSYDEFDRLSPSEAERVFAALQDREIQNALHGAFHSSAGRNLLRNARCSLRCLVELFETHSHRLQSTLEERAYNALYVLVEQVQADAAATSYTAGPGNTGENTTTAMSASKKHTNTINKASLSRKTSLSSASARNLSFRWVDGMGTTTAVVQEMAPIASPSLPLSVSPALAAVPPREKEKERETESVEYSTRITTNTTRTHSSRSASFASEQSDCSTASFAAGVAAELLHESSETHTQTQGGNGSVNTAAPTAPTGGPTEGEGAGNPTQETHTERERERARDTPFEDAFSGYDIVLLLKWLRYPYFLRNPFRSVAVVKALDTLDFVETRAVQCFVAECKEMKESLEDQHQEMSIKSIEELTELKELSRDVHEMMFERQHLQSLTKRTQDALKAKHVASRWHDTLQCLEDDWSLWRPSLSLSLRDRVAGEDARGVAHYELAKHRDLRRRNMLLTRTSEPVSHKNAAYMESKLKDQLQYLLSQQQQGERQGERDGESHTDGESAQTEEQRALLLELSALSENSGENATQQQQQSTLLSRSALSLKLAASSSAANKNPAGGGWDDDDLEEPDRKPFDSAAGESSSSGNAAISGGNNAAANAAAANAAPTLIGSLTTSLFAGTERRPAWSYLFPWASDEKILFLSQCVTQIQVDQAVQGALLLTNKCLYFHCKKRVNPANVNNNTTHSTSNHTHTQHSTGNGPLLDKRWFVDRIVEAYSRRYLLQNCAIELYFADAAEAFFAFSSLAELQRFFRILRNQSLNALLTPKTLNPRHVFKHSPWTELWKKRLISNFEYLMRLNIMAGRSFNDVTQYPVFPWVLSDYVSEEIDLKNAEFYRDLSQPVGALNPARLNDFLERYRSFDDDTVPKFMYGSHYSSAGVIMHYMIRQEPFTSMAVALQGGRFDCPDRLFFDIRRTWHGVNHSMSDVKELIPELFCCPEILMNTNRLPLGELQEGGEVNHVVLPKWAKTPFEFIRINREALESDYVSEHLHEWIDLIFGYKQTGVAAKEANNVFYYLTYEHAVDIEAIEDPLQKEAAKAQVIHFGQTPSQLLQREHPKRLPKEECILPLCTNIGRIPLIQYYTPEGLQQIGRGHGAIIALRCVGDKLVVVYSDFHVGYYRWIVSPDSNGAFPFTVKIDKLKHLPSSCLSTAEPLLRGAHALPLSQWELSGRSSDASTDAPTPPPRPTHVTASGEPLNAPSQAPQSSGVLSSWRTALMGLTAQLNVSSSQTTQSAHTTPSATPLVPLSPMRAPSHTHIGSHTSLPLNAHTQSSTLYHAMRKTRTGSLTQHTHTTPPHNTHTRRPSSHSLRPRSLTHHTHHTTLPHSIPVIPTMPAQLVSLSLCDVLAQGRVLTGGYWDGALRVHNLDSLREICVTHGAHRGGVTCLTQAAPHSALSQGGLGGSGSGSGGSDASSVVLTGGVDGTLRVWLSTERAHTTSVSASASGSGSDYHHTALSHKQFFTEPLSDEMNAVIASTQPALTTTTTPSLSLLSSPTETHVLECVHVLCGHSSPVQCLSLSHELDIVLSGGCDGTLCVHTVRDGKLVRSMTELCGSCVDVVHAASAGYLLAHSWTTQQLALFWLNGQHITSTVTEDRIECMVSAGATGNMLVCGTQTGRVSFRCVWDLVEIHYIDLHHLGSVRCLWFAEDQQFLFAGSSDGSVSVLTDPDKIASYTIQKPLLVSV